jgi:hypothetical protein
MSELLETLFWKSELEKSLEHFSLSKTSEQSVLGGIAYQPVKSRSRSKYRAYSRVDSFPRVDN